MVENNDLISRSALIAEYDRVHVGEPGGARKLIEDAPAIDAAPVVHGVWFFREFVGEDWYSIKRAWVCSNCNFRIETKNKHYHDLDTMRYCPHCGAKMDGEGYDSH